MFNLLIKKEYRNKFKFTNFLYNDLWNLCEQHFERIDEQKENASILINAMVASYNIVLYCGRTAIDDNLKINVENFIKNQLKPFGEEPVDMEAISIFSISSNESILVQLFKAAEEFLADINGEELLMNFKALEDRTLSFMNAMDLQNVLNL